MNKRYEIITSTVVIEDEEIVTYGISCNIYGIKPIYDVSVNKKTVEDLVNAMNEGDLDPIQMLEVCEDILE